MTTSKTFIAILLILICGLILASAASFARLNSLSAKLDSLREPQHTKQERQSKQDAQNDSDDTRYAELYDWYFQLSTELELLKGDINSLRQASHITAGDSADTEETAAAGSAAEPPQPEISDLQKKMERLEQAISKMEQGPSYLTPSDRVALKAEVENILQARETEENEQRFTQLKNRVLDSLYEELELGETQKEQVAKIIEQRFLETAQIREKTQSGKASREEIQQLWADVATRTDEEMARVLDAQQQEKFNRWKSDRPWWMSGGNRTGGGNPRNR